MLRHLSLAAALLAIGAGLQPVRPPYEVAEKSVAELAAALDAGEVTSRELVDGYLARIDAFDHQGPALNAVISVNPDARAEADALDRERAARGRRGPLHGIPVVIKDNYDTADMPTTAGSIALKGSIPARDAFQVKKLRDAGAIILAKTNLHEFARGITTISSLGGQTRNPYDPTRNPGGSSGGTGAAVAASFGAAGLGTDTCGSIRYPAAHNNLVGLRPTLGLTSRAGIVPLSHSQDVGGPLARSVADAVALLDVIVGADPSDPVTLRRPENLPTTYTRFLDRNALAGARIGVLTPLFGSEPEDRRAGDVVRAAVAAMRSSGAQLVDVPLAEVPSETDGVAIIGLEFKGDINAYLAQTPAAPVRTLSEVIERHLVHPSLEQSMIRANEISTLDTDAYRGLVERLAAKRAALIQAMETNNVVALVYPTLRRTAAKIGEPQRGGNCAASAATGLPAITVPAGFADDGLPVGVEFLGRAYAEGDLVKLAFAFEQATHHRRPPMVTPFLVKKGMERIR